MSEIVSPSIIKEVFDYKNTSAQKYDKGLVIVIGGSRLYTGSPTISALSALRTGADIAQIIAPQRVADIAASFSPEIISFPLEGDHLTLDHLPKLLSIVKSGEDVSHGNIAVVIGGGIGRDEKTKEAVRDFVQKSSVPVVIDADAIYAFEGPHGASFLKKEIKQPVIFTPHIYEFFILSGKNIKNLHLTERLSAVKSAAQKIGATILVKGEIDYISDGVDAKINVISVPEMTAGGTGDVLAGIAGALLARKKNPFTAAAAAVVINTLAGVIVKNEKGEGLMATDVLEKIPCAVKNELEK